MRHRGRLGCRMVVCGVCMGFYHGLIFGLGSKSLAQKLGDDVMKGGGRRRWVGA